MAAVVEMGEVDDIHSKEDNVTDGVIMNGDIADDEKPKEIVNLNDKDASESDGIDDDDEEGVEEEDVEKPIESIAQYISANEDEDEEIEKHAEISDEEDEDDAESDSESHKNDDEVMEVDNSIDEIDDEKELEAKLDTEEEDEVGKLDTEEEDVSSVIEENSVEERISQGDDDDEEEIHNIDSDDDDDVEMMEVDKIKDKTIEIVDDCLLDESDDDINEVASIASIDARIDAKIDTKMDTKSKENGTETPEKLKKGEIIELDTPDKVTPPGVSVGVSARKAINLTPRRSTRNLSRKTYIDDTSDKEAIASSEESDIEEILPEDPLACTDPITAEHKSGTTHQLGSIKVKRNLSATIVVKDTKRLVEIASKSQQQPNNNVINHHHQPHQQHHKKEPTLVIIDTNSILSGRGPIPLSHKSANFHANTLPVALPAQGIYPANMRATITPIPMSNHQTNSKQTNQTQSSILPSLTDDMFVVEAPSFIVPYVYEKPPVKDLKGFVKKMADEIKKRIEDSEKEEEKRETEAKAKSNADSDDEEDLKMEIDEVKLDKKVEAIAVEAPPKHTYFDSPIGKFFVDIGSSLVQEFIQTDLLKQQKRKREREHGQNSQTNKTIISLLKSLEYTKENNEPYKMVAKKCEFCSYKTESALAMAFHLETPHMKNFVYRCNFCTYEVRSPHDILFHMEAEHCIRGRLERAPAFHQCPNCPFEDNQKGKLSRHLVACTRKFKPERNLEPPIDWEPPAKIPRAPRMKQSQSLTSTAAMYQAMAKTSQLQYMKMQANAHSALNRGRGRPNIGGSNVVSVGKQQQQQQQQVGKSATTMVYKQTVPGGASVLVPTNYQISGNQLYQVLGGTDLGSRISGHMALVPNMSASSIMQKNAGSKSKTSHHPSISITPLPRGSTTSSSSSSTAAAAAASTAPSTGGQKPGDSNSKNSFVICEICDGYIKDLEQLRNHMQWIHKVKIHPKMIYNRPPLNCQKCQFRFFTDQGLERHLLGSHGLVTSSMQEAANKCKDSGRCPVCGRVYQWKLLNHVARDHNMTLKPAHLSYKCTVCTATFGMYKQFENHVYSAHSVVAKRSIDKKSSSSSSNTSSPNKTSNESLLKPLKINDEITIIPQQPKSNGAGGGSSKDSAATSKTSNNSTPSTSKIGDTSITRAERLARRKTSLVGDN